MGLSDSFELDFEIEEPSASNVVQTHEQPDANGWYLVPSDWYDTECPNTEIRYSNPKLEVEYEDGGRDYINAAFHLGNCSQFDFSQSRKFCRIVSYKVIE